MKETTRKQIEYFLIAVLIATVAAAISVKTGWWLPALDPMPH
jgi:Flp pilus assembly pilin Flp